MRIVKRLIVGASAAAVMLAPGHHAMAQETVSPGTAVEGTLEILKQRQGGKPTGRLDKSGLILRSAFGCFFDGSQIDPRAIGTSSIPGAGDVGKVKSHTVGLVRALSLAGFRRADVEQKLRPVFSRYGCNPDFVDQAMASSRSGQDIGGTYVSFAPVLGFDASTLNLGKGAIGKFGLPRQGIIVDDEEANARTVVTFEDMHDPGAICRDTNFLLYDEPGICAQNRERYERYATGQYTLFDYCEAQAAGIDPRTGMGLTEVGVGVAITMIGIGVSRYLDHRDEIRQKHAELEFQRERVKSLEQDLIFSKEKINSLVDQEISSGGFFDLSTDKNKEAARQAIIERDLENAKAEVKKLEKEVDILPPKDGGRFDYESLRVCLENPAMRQSFKQSMQAAHRLSLSCRGDLFDSRIVDPEQPSPSDGTETVAPRSQCNVAGLQAHLGSLVSEIDREDTRTDLEAAAAAAARTRAEKWANAQCPRCSDGERCIRDEEKSKYICEAVELDLEVDKLPEAVRTVVQQEMDKFERDFEMQEEAWQRQMGRSPEVLADPHNQHYVWQHLTIAPPRSAGGPRSPANNLPPLRKGGGR